MENGLSPRLSLGTGIWFGPGDELGAAGQVPFAPGGNHLDVGRQRGDAEFEADLIIALAGGAVGDGIGAGFAGDFHQTLGNERAGYAGAQKIITLITGIGAHHREDEIAHEFLADIVNVDMFGLDAHQHRLFAGRGQFAFLPQISGECHHFAIIGYLEPLEDHRGVEAARIGKNDAFDGGHGRGAPGVAIRLSGGRVAVTLEFGKGEGVKGKKRGARLSHLMLAAIP